MDPIVLAALKAALTAEDPKAAIEALIAQLEGGDSAPAPEGDPETLEQRAAGAPVEEEPARSAVVLPAARPVAPLPQRQAVSAPRRAIVAASQVVGRAEFERFQVATILDKRPDLTEAQRSFAMGLKPAEVESFLKLTPVAAKAALSAPATAERAQIGTRASTGARPAAAPEPEDDTLRDVDRRMGVQVEETPTVHRDPTTGRLTISALRPMRVKAVK